MPDDKVQLFDAQGLSCPAPIINLSERMKGMNEGELLKMLADDAGALEDIPAWCRRTGNPLLTIEEKDGLITALIRKR